MGASRLATCSIVLALVAAGCGGDGGFTAVEQSPTTPAAATAPPAGPSAEATVTNIGPRYNRVFAQLIDARTALDTSAQGVAAAAKDAQGLVDKIAAGYNAPPGSAAEVQRLRSALSSFSDVLQPILTSSQQLPRLSTELKLRSAQLAKRKPRAAAALITARQQVDAAIAELARLDTELGSAESKVRQQQSADALDGKALDAAVASARESSAAAAAQVNQAIDTGFTALASAA